MKKKEDLNKILADYGIDNAELTDKILVLFGVIQRSEQLNAFREFAKQNYQGLALFSLEEIMDEYLKSI